MPRVVFWSPCAGETGNTHTAIAVSTLMSIAHKTTCLLMHGNFNSKKIESSFTPYDNLIESGALDNQNLGASALIRLVTSNKLTSDAIQNYAKPVLKNRLDVLYGMTSKDKDGYQDLVNNLPYITRKAAEIYDLVMLDLPKTANQKFIKDVLADSEVIVCTVNQDEVKLDEFFDKITSLEELKEKNVIFVISDYENKSRYNLTNIRNKYKNKYQIQEPLYALPHNYFFSDACNAGAVVDFFYRNLNASPKDYNGYFVSQTNEIVERIFEILKLRDN